MIPHEVFISNIIQSLNNTQLTIPPYFKKIINIIKKLLCKSKYAKILESTRLDMAFSSIPSKDA